MNEWNEKWQDPRWQPDPVVTSDGPTAADPAMAFAVSLSSPSLLEVSTSEGGVVLGTLTLAHGVVLKVFGTVAPANLPDNSLGSFSRIMGYFVPRNGNVITAPGYWHRPVEER